MAALTPKQQRFVEEYLVDLNAAASARRAGYSTRSPKSAAATGSRLLRQEPVRQAVREAMLERRRRTKISADYVLSNLVEIVERSMQRAPVTAGRGAQAVDGEGRHVWRFDGRTANRALELIGRHLGMFADRAVRESGGPLAIAWEKTGSAEDARQEPESAPEEEREET